MFDLTGKTALVTGASGGVGSVAVAVLARLGYQVAAVTGRAETEGYLRDLGAARIVPRAESWSAPPPPPPPVLLPQASE